MIAGDCIPQRMIAGIVHNRITAGIDVLVVVVVVVDGLVFRWGDGFAFFDIAFRIADCIQSLYDTFGL